MKSHPYVRADGTYYPETGYWGYFKQDMYYRYDVSANTYWQENSACTNSDKRGSHGCISGRLLNYVTSNELRVYAVCSVSGTTA